MATNVVKTVKGSGGDYTSLSAWEAGEQRDLVGSNHIASAECYSFQDGSNVTLSGWTTGTANYINIYTLATDRSVGAFDSSKYLLNVTANDDSISIALMHDVAIDGLQIITDSNITARSCILFAVNLDVRKLDVSNCFLRGGTSGGLIAKAGVEVESPNVRVWNNIIVDVVNGIRQVSAFSGTTAVYNNTFWNTGSGPLNVTGGAVRLKNNIDQFGTLGSVGLGTSAFYTSDSNYNLTQGTAAPGANSITQGTVIFAGTATLDLRLTRGASAQDVGTDLSTDSIIAFSTDIAGGTRPRFGTWDMGAHEATLGLARKTTQYRWDVGTLVGKASQYLWDVGTLAGQAPQFLWSVRNPLPQREDFFLEVEAGYQLRRWDASGTTNVWKHGFTEYDPVGLKVDGTAYTEARTLADCAGTVQTWFVDRGTQVYVNTGGTDPNTKVCELDSVWHFARTSGMTAKKLGLYNTITPIFWDGRLQAVPSVRYYQSPDALGGGNQYSFGNVVLSNEDNRFMRYAEALLYGRPVRAYTGKGEVLPTDFELVSRMRISSVAKDRRTLTLSLDQDIATLNKPVNGGSTYAPGTDGNQNIKGQPTPFVIGRLKGVPAYMMGTTGTVGTFRLCSHNFSSISAVRDSRGTALSSPTILGTEGLFTARFGATDGTRYLSEAVFADAVGYGGTTTVGAALLAILRDRAGVAAADLLTNDFDTVDDDRSVEISGWLGRNETVRDTMDLLSRSAFVNWGITRQGKYTAWIKRTDFDANTEIIDPSFELGGTAWLDAGSGTHTGTTLPWLSTEDPEGTRVAQLSKPGGTAGTRARIYQGGITARTGTTYLMSAWAALQSGTLGSFRLEYSDAGGTAHRSSPQALSATAFIRHFGLVEVGTTGKGTLSVYADFDGTTAGTAWVDLIRFHAVKVIADHQITQPHTIVVPPRNDKVNVRYVNTANNVDRAPPRGLEQDEDFKSSFVSATAARAGKLYSLEAMTHEGVLWGTADAQTVANAIITERSRQKLVLELNFLDTAESLTITRGDIVYLAGTHDTWLPGGERTFLVGEVSENFERRGPRINGIRAERAIAAVYDYHDI